MIKINLCMVQDDFIGARQSHHSDVSKMFVYKDYYYATNKLLNFSDQLHLNPLINLNKYMLILMLFNLFFRGMLFNL